MEWLLARKKATSIGNWNFKKAEHREVTCSKSNFLMMTWDLLRWLHSKFTNQHLKLRRTKYSLWMTEWRCANRSILLPFCYGSIFQLFIKTFLLFSYKRNVWIWTPEDFIWVVLSIFSLILFPTYSDSNCLNVQADRFTLEQKLSTAGTALCFICRRVALF